jgi:hypothetical protein
MDEIIQNQAYPNVFGISGRKRHGKDFFSKILLRTRQDTGLSPDFTIVHFAGELKRQAGIVFGLTYGQLDGSQKESLLPEPIEMDSFLEAMSLESGLDLKPAGFIAKTPREVMQALGTEYVRRIKPSYWVDVVLDKIAACKGNVLVPDTRFPNEADAIRSVGGKVIKIQRLDLPETLDGHSSETEMEKIDPDLLLGTITDNFWLQNFAAKNIVDGHFGVAQRYDYRKVQRALAELKGGGDTRDIASLLNRPYVEVESLLEYYKVSCVNCLGYRYLDEHYNVWRGQLTEKLTPCHLCKPNPEAQLLS